MNKGWWITCYKVKETCSKPNKFRGKVPLHRN